MFIIKFHERFSSSAKYISEKYISTNPPSINEPKTITLQTKSIASNFKIFFSLLIYVYSGRDEVFAPRSNSRSLSLILSFFSNRIKLFLYSDGIGDEVNSCRLEKLNSFSGFIGYDVNFVKDVYIHKIPKIYMLESWADKIIHNENGYLLIIAKFPKEIPYPKSLVVKLYQDELKNNYPAIPVIASGDNEIINELSSLFKVVNIGSLTSLKRNLNVKFCYGLPSTAFITFLNRLPNDNVKILDLPAFPGFEEAVARNAKMKKVINEWSS